jgi:2-dehydro-3-deoxyphosphogluconate aldolase/(4S)-4-hydroxy-2-oxoglutarate aldolase
VPTGGVTLANAIEFLQAGAIGVGLSGDLFPAAVIQAGNWELITQQAATLVKQLADLRSDAISGKQMSGAVEG